MKIIGHALEMTNVQKISQKWHAPNFYVLNPPLVITRIWDPRDRVQTVFSDIFWVDVGLIYIYIYICIYIYIYHFSKQNTLKKRTTQNILESNVKSHQKLELNSNFKVDKRFIMNKNSIPMFNNKYKLKITWFYVK